MGIGWVAVKAAELAAADRAVGPVQLGAGALTVPVWFGYQSTTTAGMMAVAAGLGLVINKEAFFYLERSFADYVHLVDFFVDDASRRRTIMARAREITAGFSTAAGSVVVTARSDATGEAGVGFMPSSLYTNRLRSYDPGSPLLPGKYIEARVVATDKSITAVSDLIVRRNRA